MKHLFMVMAVVVLACGPDSYGDTQAERSMLWCRDFCGPYDLIAFGAGCYCAPTKTVCAAPTDGGSK